MNFVKIKWNNGFEYKSILTIFPHDVKLISLTVFFKSFVKALMSAQSYFPKKKKKNQMSFNTVTMLFVSCKIKG